MAKRRRLKKSGGGDLEVHNQNVVSSDKAIIKENVVSSDQAIVEQIIFSSN
jgi:hypothetical protein